jgi:hypothetical protein
MQRLMPIVMSAQRKGGVRSMIEKSMTEGLGPPDGQPITEEQHNEVASRVTEPYMLLLDHEGAFDQTTKRDPLLGGALNHVSLPDVVVRLANRPRAVNPRCAGKVGPEQRFEGLALTRDLRRSFYKRSAFIAAATVRSPLTTR